MLCATVSAVLFDIVYIGIWCCVCYVEQCCVYGTNRQTVHCGSFSAVLCDRDHIGIWFLVCYVYKSIVYGRKKQ